MDWDRKRAEAVQIAITAGFGRADAEILAESSRPALRLVPASRGRAPVGASRIGGLADLAPDMEWPSGEYGPMTLCGQIRGPDTAALSGVDGWTARDSLLCFFADLDPETAEVAGGCVLAVPLGLAVPREAPAGRRAGAAIEATPVDLRPVLTPPMTFDVDAPELEHDFDADEWEAWERLYEGLGCGRPTVTTGHHQLLGHPWAVGDLDPVWSGGVRLAAAGEDPDDEDSPFRLLAQFTNDDEIGLEIGDGGAIYFVGRATDFAAGRFDEVVVFAETN